MSFDFRKSFLLFLVQSLLQIQVTLQLPYVIVWERKTRLFMTLFEVKPVILHACACALIKEVCVTPDSFSITSCTLPSSCEMNQLGFDLSH